MREKTPDMPSPDQNPPSPEFVCVVTITFTLYLCDVTKIIGFSPSTQSSDCAGYSPPKGKKKGKKKERKSFVTLEGVRNL